MVIRMKVTDKKSSIIEIFKKNHGYARSKDIVNEGINKAHIVDLLRNGIIQKVKRGLYKLTNFDTSNDFIEITKIIPKAVICLGSALSYYELTSYNPIEYHVAIFREDKVQLPAYPPIKVFYFSEAQFKIGITETIIEGVPVKIYDMEKTICDCVRYRNKLGKDVLKESINEYLNKSNRNIPKLLKYGKDLRVIKILEKYLEVLI